MKIKVQPTSYIYPPRAETCVPRNEAKIFMDMGWKPQYKYNDSRCLIKILPGNNIELWNRHGERFRTYTAPDWLHMELLEVAGALGLTSDSWHLLDGGLLDQKHQAIKDTIVIWDILVKEGEHLLGTTYQERYQILQNSISSEETFWYTHKTHQPINFGIKLTNHTLLARQYEPKDYESMWQTVQTVNAPYSTPTDIKPVLEGVIIKDPNGRLEMGYKEKNNTDWMVKSRVTTGRHRF